MVSGVYESILHQYWPHLTALTLLLQFHFLSNRCYCPLDSKYHIEAILSKTKKSKNLAATCRAGPFKHYAKCFGLLPFWLSQFTKKMVSLLNLELGHSHWWLGPLSLHLRGYYFVRNGLLTLVVFDLIFCS